MAASVEQPNILLIVADQLRYDSLGYSSGGRVKTPNLDRLANRGQVFNHAYSAIPTCCPARQAILRGKTAESFGAYWNYDITLPIATLDSTEDNWVHSINKRGYQCSYVGKWHVHPDKDPTEFGFDDYYSVLDYANYVRQTVPDLRYENGWRGEKDKAPVEQSRTHVLAAQAAEKIRKYANARQPWHVRLDFPEPHLPCRPAGRFADMYNPSEIEPWPGFDDPLIGKPYIQGQQLKTWHVENYEWKDWAPIVARYFGIISQMDDAIGNVIAALEETGQQEETIVIFTADHGDLCGSHGMVDKHYVMYDDVVRVPLMVAGPGVVTRETPSEAFVSATLDIAPTLLELTSTDLMADLQGRSLTPILAGQEEDVGRHVAFSSYNGAQFGLYSQRMVRTKHWKYIWNLVAEDELYDLENDPAETTNLIGDTEIADRLTDLRAQLYKEMTAVGDPLLRGPWLRDQLLGGDSITSLELPETV
jgi:arylsulfatase A-like enzyme